MLNKVALCKKKSTERGAFGALHSGTEVTGLGRTSFAVFGLEFRLRPILARSSSGLDDLIDITFVAHDDLFADCQIFR